jgi:ferritin-like metal-binding protein YciE
LANGTRHRARSSRRVLEPAIALNAQATRELNGVATGFSHQRDFAQARFRRQSKLQPKDNAMGLFSKDIASMDDLFMHQLQDIYYAEKRIVTALPGMIEKATSPELRLAFTKHLGETKNHVKRVERVFEIYGADPESVRCPAIDGIIDEADEVAGDVADKKVLDAALIAAAQAVEHYEMTRYGTLIAWAKELGRDDCARVLKENLTEEHAADKKLTDIAESSVNMAAA